MGKYCPEKHEWSKCHMYGLGIYLADMAQKSHRYVSQPQAGKAGRQTYRMVVCTVLGKSFQIEGHLRQPHSMHDVVNVRALTDETVNDMIDHCPSCSPCCSASHSGVGASIVGQDNFEVAEKSDLLFVKGLGSAVRPGFSVVNSEYIALHPHQCLPKYEIEYELGDDWW